MKIKGLLGLSLLFLVQMTNGYAQATKEMRTTKTPLVINGKWVQSSYDYDPETGEYYFVNDGKRVLLTTTLQRVKTI